MLKIEHLTKYYGGKIAVNDLSLHIGAGEICGFIGHNGAGKTTTIKACVGIIPITAGDIFIDGVSVRRDPIACKKKLAYIPDNPDLYEFMKGIRYLNFVADVYGVGADERKAKIDEYAEMFSLTNDLASPISSYSHGMKQKLAVIAAMLHSPSLLIMDEPFVGLDPSASKNLKDMMHRFTADGGAIFFSTHVLEVAEKLCDRVAIIKSGTLVTDGAMADVLGNESLEDVFLELQ
jgi:ABC-2 type transport system ATP-binding protein